MVLTRSEMAKAFTKEGEAKGLKMETLQRLAADDIDTCAVLCLCSLSDIDQLHLSKGQSLVVKQWVSLLNTKAAASTAPSSAPSLTGETLEFRRKQHAQSKPWDQDDSYLANFHLRKRDPAQRNQTSQRRQRYTSDPRVSSGVEICRNYNASGCDRPVCRYSHSCAVCRVKGHPSAAHGHNQTFRPQAPPFASRPV